MSINLKQNNHTGDNNALLNESSNSTSIQIKNKIVWKARAEGAIVGVILSVIANFIYDFLK